MPEESKTFDSWAVVELMGHIRTAGRVTEEERFGSMMGRCDVPDDGSGFTTFYFSGASVFRLTPCTEEAARALARRSQPEPVHQWELPAPREQPPRRDPHPLDPDFNPDDDDYGPETGDDIEDDSRGLRL